MNTLTTAVRNRLVSSGTPVSPSSVAAALRAEGGVLGDSELLDLTRRLSAELSGAGPLEELMLPGVTDILVNGPEEVWVDSGEGLRRADVRLGSEEELRRLAQRLAARAGRRLIRPCRTWTPTFPGCSATRRAPTHFAGGDPHVTTPATNPSLHLGRTHRASLAHFPGCRAASGRCHRTHGVLGDRWYRDR